MVPDEAEPVRRLLVYDEETAGGLMTTEPVIMRAADTVAEALARVRDPDLLPALAGQVFVVRAPTRPRPAATWAWPTCSGCCGTAQEELGACMDADLDCLGPEADPAGGRVRSAYDLLAAPVCDPQGRLLGRCSIDDVLDHLLPEAWRRGAGWPGEGAAGRGPADLVAGAPRSRPASSSSPTTTRRRSGASPRPSPASWAPPRYLVFQTAVVACGSSGT